MMKTQDKTPREGNGLPENYDDYKWPEKEKRKCILFLFSILFVGSYIFYGNILISIMIGSLSLKGYILFQDVYIKKRRALLVEEFKDALYIISSSINGGNTMLQAMKDSCQGLQLIYPEHSYIAKEFNFILKRVEEAGESMDIAFSEFAKRSGVEDIIDFVEIYNLTQRMGGDLSSMIEKTWNIIIEKINIKKEIDVLVSQKKYEGLILVAMPFIIILFITFVSPGYFEKMYTTVTGRIGMTIGLLVIGIAYKWSEKIMQIHI